MHIGELMADVGGGKLYLETLEDDHEPIFIWLQPMYQEQGCDAATELLEALGGALRWVIFDSVHAMTPKAVLEGSNEDDFVAVRARKLGQFVPGYLNKCFQNGTTAVYINQIRDIIGSVGFGPQTQTTGGRTLRFYSHQRLKMGSGEKHVWKSVLGDASHMSYIQVVKNKARDSKGVRKGRTHLIIWPGRGFSPECELIDLCIEKGVLKSEGSGLFSFRSDGPWKRIDLLKACMKKQGKAIQKLFLDDLQSKVNGSPIYFKDCEPKVGFEFTGLPDENSE